VEKLFAGKKPHNGLTYQDYFAQYEQLINNGINELHTETELERANNIKLNHQRSSRIHKSYKPGEELVKAARQIDRPQLWVVLSEHWCGDSAQNLPYLAEIAKLNSNINLRIILRDENPEIMDEYLTDGNLRSIPILIVFDYEGNELFRWGPRPKTADGLVSNSKK